MSGALVLFWSIAAQVRARDADSECNADEGEVQEPINALAANEYEHAIAEENMRNCGDCGDHAVLHCEELH